jgi:hypothetical protein
MSLIRIKTERRINLLRSYGKVTARLFIVVVRFGR